MLKRYEEVVRIERKLEPARPGDILLFYNATGVSHIIPLLTHSPYFHVGIYAGDAEIVESRPVGVIRRDLRDVDDIHDFVVLPGPSAARRGALAWAETQIGAGYDHADTLVIVLDRILTRLHLHYNPGGRWTCGEFVATAFHQAGDCLFPDEELADIEPADFARLLPPGSGPADLAKADARQKLGAAISAVAALAALGFVARAVRRAVHRQPCPTDEGLSF